jgi:hypothetical protein
MPYTDWIGITDPTLQNKSTLSILEFGLGEGTKYLLDNFMYVYSYELNDDHHPEYIEWWDKSNDDYKSYSNWGRELHWYSEVGFIDHNPILPEKLTERIDELFREHNFDAVLVDGVGHCRGDVANYILHNHSPNYVIIHDTNFNYEVDGYGRIQLPSQYETIIYTEGEGTHIFVKK